jgi:thiamine biosynthesis lipoprotein
MVNVVAPTMGTTVSIDVRDPEVECRLVDAAIAGAISALAELEARFSTYRPDSDVCRIERGELALADAHPDVREVLAACDVLRAESEGAFDAWRDGRLDPSGYVKGWAGERAADVLRRVGLGSFALNIGGDIGCAGGASATAPWRVGIRDPFDARRLLAVVAIRDGAVATSGDYERGAHVVDPRTGRAASAWASVTVLAPDLATADAIATAALAMDEAGPAWAASRPGCSVAAVDPDGGLWSSPAFEAERVA